LASACITPPPDVPPLLQITSANCAAVPDLSTVVPTVATIDGDDEKPAIVTLDATSRCLAGTTGKSLYAIFSIPDGGPYTINVSSVSLGRSILAPKAEVLDAQGAVLHELPTSSFLFRGTNLTSLYRSHAGERYLLVQSDPANVGKPLQRLKENVQVNAVGTGYVYVEIHTGTDVASTATWSHNGQISVSVVRDKPAKR